MRGKWDNSIKDKAKLLREQGYSYGLLSKELKIPRSTLHQWVRGIMRPIKFTKLDRIRWIKEIQPLGAQGNKKRSNDNLDRIIKEINEEISLIIINQEMKKIIVSMLYWAEGSKGKGGMCFANTDPRLMALFVKLIRSCYELDESKFRIRLHLHYYHKAKKVKTFWSKLLNIPLRQFEKIYRKSRSKEKTFRRNFGGICFVRYHSVYLKEKIVQYGYIFGEKVTGKVNVPVA